MHNIHNVVMCNIYTIYVYALGWTNNSLYYNEVIVTTYYCGVLVQHMSVILAFPDPYIVM